VRLLDNCDPATFNEAIPPQNPGDPPTCIPHGKKHTVTFAEFRAKLNPTDFGHEDWANKPDEVDLNVGDSIKAVVRGGEFHTFTKVNEFGPGCVPFINESLGLTGPPAADCGLIPATGVLPNGLSTLTVSGLAPGTYKYMCLIHPWMRTVVTVEGDEQDED
jgi:plastocyanin